MQRKLFTLSALLVSLTCMAHVADAAQRTVEDDESDAEWTEVAAQMPDAPKQENLLPFYQSETQSFSIDTKSLSVAADGTVRYTLVAVSRAGAKNVSYEAIRCASYEKKLYAFGRSDGSWSRSRRNDWQHISSMETNLQHTTLASEYFCQGNTVAGKVNVILNRLKRTPRTTDIF